METVVSSARSLIGWALLVVLVAATLALGANRPVSWTLMTMAVGGLFLLTLILDMFQKGPRVLGKLWFPAFLFLAVLIWAAMQTLPGILPSGWAHPVWQFAPEGTVARVSADPVKGAHIIMRLSGYAMVFWIALRCYQDKDAALRAMQVFALFSTGLAAFGLYAAATGSNPILGSFANDSVSATFVNRNNYATFAAFGLVTSVALLLRTAGNAQGNRNSAMAGFLRGMVSGGGWIWLVGVTLCGGAIMLSLSRGGAAAAVVGILVLITVRRQRGSTAAIGPSLIIGGIVLAIFLSGSTGTINRMISTSDENGRFAIYPTVVDAIGDRPLLGHGIGSFETAFRAYVPFEAANGEWDMAHNSYLENAFEMGLPAATAFYLALLAIGYRLFRGLQERQRNRTPVAIAFACFMLAGFHAMFDFSLQMPALAAFFAWILGIGYAQSFPKAALKEGPS